MNVRITKSDGVTAQGRLVSEPTQERPQWVVEVEKARGAMSIVAIHNLDVIRVRIVK
jgi:hypothetical protein